MSSSVAKAGAAYEAVLVDNVTGNVKQIIKSIDRLKQSFDQVAPVANEVGISMQRMGQGMQMGAQASRAMAERAASMGQKFSRMAATINTAGQAIGQTMIHMGNQFKIAGIAMLGFAGLFTNSIRNMVMENASFKEQMSAFNQIFTESSYDVEEWAKKFSKSVRRSLTETITGLVRFKSVLADSLLDPQQADEMAKDLQRVSVDLASFMEVQDSRVIDAVSGAITGEAEALKRLGINTQVAQMEEFVKAQGKVWKDLSLGEKAWARYQKIMYAANNTLKATGDAMRTRDSLPNMMKALTAAIEEVRRAIGEKFEPAMRVIVEMMTEVAESFQGISGTTVNRIIGLIVALAGAGAGLLALGSVLTALGPFVLATATIAASAISLIGALVAMGPAGVIGGALGIGGVIAGTWLMMKVFPAEEALRSLQSIAMSIGADLEQAGMDIASFGQAGQWDQVWETFKTTGELAIRELADFIAIQFSNAVKNSFTGLAENLKSGLMYFLDPRNMPVVDLLTDAFFGAVDSASGAGGSSADAKAALRADRAEQTRTAKVLDLARKAAKTQEKLMEETARKLFQESPSPFREMDARDRADIMAERMASAVKEDEGDAFRHMPRMTSLASASASFAANAGLFGPAMTSHYDKIEKEQKNTTEAVRDNTKAIDTQTQVMQNSGLFFQ